VNSQVDMKVSEVFIVVGAQMLVLSTYVYLLTTLMSFCIQASHRSVMTFLAESWLPNVLVTFHRLTNK